MLDFFDLTDEKELLHFCIIHFAAVAAEAEEKAEVAEIGRRGCVDGRGGLGSGNLGGGGDGCGGNSEGWGYQVSILQFSSFSLCSTFIFLLFFSKHCFISLFFPFNMFLSLCQRRLMPKWLYPKTVCYTIKCTTLLPPFSYR